VSTAAADDPQLRPILLRPQDRRLPLTRQILEAVGVEQGLVELPTLEVAHIAGRRVADCQLDAAAQRGACQWWSLEGARYWAGALGQSRPPGDRR
jgi:hypothetical protein